MCPNTNNGNSDTPKETPNGPIHFDWLVSKRLGEFGKYQRRIYIMLGFPCMVCAFHVLAWVFLGANVKYRCALPGENLESANYYNLPPGYSFNESYPVEENDQPSQCKRFATAEDQAETETVPCSNYIYDNSQYKTSARMDFRLICDSKYYYTVAETLFKSGILIGAFIMGIVSDRFGRRPTFFFVLCLQVSCGVIASMAPNYTVFVIARFLIGMSHAGAFMVAFVLALEMVGKSKRVIASMGLQFFFAIGWMGVGVLAYFIREWRYLQLTLSLPGLCFLSYYWFLPESVPWLLTHNKKEEAIKILEKVAEVNGTKNMPDLSNLVMKDTSSATSASVPILEAFRHRKTMLRAVNVFFCWFVNSGVYYGLAMNSSNLGGNDYINFMLSGGVEIPAYTILILTLNKFGRRLMLSSCLIISGLFLIGCGLTTNTTLLVTLNMLGKLFNAASYAVIWMYAGELFPTVVRNSFMGISSVCARVGGILADYVIILRNTWQPLPHIIFGVISLTSGVLSLLLPETLGKRLPDTLEDSEKFGTSEYDNGPAGRNSAKDESKL